MVICISICSSEMFLALFGNNVSLCLEIDYLLQFQYVICLDKWYSY